MTRDDAVDDGALVLAAQHGDREAFGLLVERHASSVLGLTRRMLGATPDADDIAQEAFVAAFRALATFHGGSRFSTWLYRIAINKCRDALRARRYGHVPLDDPGGDGPDDWIEADVASPLDELVGGELAGELERAVQALPPLYRESFLLRHVEGMEYDEMSAVLRVNRDTLKMRVYKARTLLCRQLAHLEGVRR